MTKESYAAGVAGFLDMQVCGECGAVQYPPREVCRHCLADTLAWEKVENTGEVRSWTALHASTRDFFSKNLPWHVASLKLDCGINIYAYIDSRCASTGARVRVYRVTDALGQGVFVAAEINGSSRQDFDKLHELTGRAADEQ